MRNLFASSALAISACACGGTGNSPPVELKDSAGIQITQTNRPLREDSNGWGISGPTLVIRTDPSNRAQVIHWMRGVVRLSDGRLVALSESSKELLFFDEHGRWLWSASGEGQGPGELMKPYTLMLLPGDTIIVGERALSRVSWFSHQGEFIRSIVPDLQAVISAAPKGFRLTGNPRFIPPDLVLWRAWDLSDRPVGRRYRLPATFFLTTLKGAQPTFLGFYRGQERFELDKRVGWQATFQNTTVAAVGGSPPQIVLGETDSLIFRVFDTEGRLIRIIRDAISQDPIDDERIEWERTSWLNWGETVGGDRWERLWRDIPLPESIPAFEDLVVDSLGYLWAMEYSNLRPTPVRWRVYSTEGERVGALQMPGRLRVFGIGDDYLCGIYIELNDEETIHCYGLSRGGY